MSSSFLGATVGHFRILDALGKGGMGEVFVGYDEKLHRKVALKSIRAEHRLDAEAKARFLREARVLSQLRHPNICQIFDYVEGAEADFLALELIDGERLTEAMKRGTDSKLKFQIAEQIVGALVAAHEQGIVHRDLKPDNVMVADGPQVKVLDFGLSRTQMEEATISLPLSPAAGTVPPEPGTDETAVRGGGSAPTGAGGASGGTSGVTTLGAIMGTLGYMSPEQARGEQATSASDLYSFGLILQELFTGKHPYAKGLDGATRLQKAREGESLPAEGLDPDLAALIGRLKSLAPAARPSAVDTGERLAWIRDKPLRRRKKVLLAAAVAILVVFSVATTVQTIRATRAEAAAKKEAETSRRVATFLEEMFKISDPNEAKGNSVTARQILDQASERIQNQTDLQPEIRARLMNTIGDVYSSLGLYATAEPLIDTGLAIREKTLDPGHLDVASSLDSRANLYLAQGRYAEAESLGRRAVAIRENALGPDHPDLASSLHNLSRTCALQGKFGEAEPLIRRALAIREKVFGADHSEVAVSLTGLANLRWRQGRYAEAESLHKKALAIKEKTLGPDHPDVGKSLNDLAIIYQVQGRDAEAELLIRRGLAIREKVFGPDHPGVALSLNNLALALTAQGKLAEADALLIRALKTMTKAFGAEHPRVAVIQDTLATLRYKQGRNQEAEELYIQAAKVLAKADDGSLPEVLGNHATMLRELGRTAEAATLEARAEAFKKAHNR